MALKKNGNLLEGGKVFPDLFRMLGRCTFTRLVDRHGVLLDVPVPVRQLQLVQSQNSQMLSKF